MLFVPDETLVSSIRAGAKLVAACISVWSKESRSYFTRLMHSFALLYQPSLAEQSPNDMLPFMSPLIRCFAKWGQQDKLSHEDKLFYVTTILHDAVLPAIFVDRHPRDSRPSRSLLMLAQLCPDYVVPIIMERVLPIITDSPTIVTRPPHYFSCALEALAVIMPCLIQSSTYITSIQTLLDNSLRAIDANDLRQTNCVLKFYFRFFLFVPLFEAPPDYNVPADIANYKLVVQQVKASKYFPTFITKLLDHIIRFLLIQDEQMSESRDVKPEEGTFSVLFQIFSRTLFSQLSPSLYSMAITRLCTLLRCTSLPSSAWKLAASLIFSATHANPAKALDMMFPILRSQLYEGRTPQKTLLLAELSG